MSRGGRGRGGNMVPLDSALFRENSNCPTAARSAGTVGKWGMTSFTSIRSSYVYTSNAQNSVQDQNSPLADVNVENEAQQAKPKKFFKSRNVARPDPSLPQITYAPPVPAAPLSPEHPSFNQKSDKTPRNKKRVYSTSSSSPEYYEPSEKISKNKDKNKTKRVHNRKAVSGEPSKKQEVTEFDEDKLDINIQPPNKRYLVRNRNKRINYAEDGSKSPILSSASMPITHDTLTKATISTVESSVISPPNKDVSDERKPPPIVLRICKGISTIVVAETNENVTSTSSEQCPQDVNPDSNINQNSQVTISSFSHDLKMTIKRPSYDAETKSRSSRDEKFEEETDVTVRKSRKHSHHSDNGDDIFTKKHSSNSGHHDSKRKSKKKRLEVDADSCMPDFELNVNNDEKKVKEKKKKLHKNNDIHLNEIDPVGLPMKYQNIDNDDINPDGSDSSRTLRRRKKINYSENNDYFDKYLLTNNKNFIKKEKGKSITKTECTSKEQCSTSDDKQEHNLRTHSKRVSTCTETSDLSLDDDGNDQTDNESEDEVLLNKESKSVTVETVESQNEPVRQAEEPYHCEDLSLNENKPVLEEAEPMSTSMEDSHQSESSFDTRTLENNKQTLHSLTKLAEDPKQISDTKAYDDCNETAAEDKPSVKLVLTKKKGSIFKSKSLVNDNPSPLPARKRRHLYRHEWANNGKGNETPTGEPEQSDNTETQKSTYTALQQTVHVTVHRAETLMDSSDELDDGYSKPHTSIKCPKDSKEYYTVIRNVKKAHQIQEIGEFQEFNDDVEYILDALQHNNPMATRCLSAITLASKCTAPAFRMHVRAHGTVQKFFSALHDAANDQSLGLCTATVMFVLSQDRLNMDLDKESLELMLNLLESDVSHKNALDDCGLTSSQLAKNKERVRELCAEIKNQGNAEHLDLDNITVGNLAMETLLSLTSKRAGEWFKEELRVLGGVDHILKTIQDCVKRLETSLTYRANGSVIDILRKADRCMRVLENVTQENEENQIYLITGERAGVAGTLASLLHLCIRESKHISMLEPKSDVLLPLSTAFLDCALQTITVLVNLSHSFSVADSVGADVVGQHISVMEDCLNILCNRGNFLPEKRNFEFTFCALLLLINLVQNNKHNTLQLLDVSVRVEMMNDSPPKKTPALAVIVEHFFKRDELATRAEQNTDAILDGEPAEKVDDKEKQNPPKIDETINELQKRAGVHMDHSMIGAYVALLLGHIALVSPEMALDVRCLVPSYVPLLTVLQKYNKFLNLTPSSENITHRRTTERIIQFMEISDKEATQLDEPESEPQDMSLSHLDRQLEMYNN